MTIYIYVKTHTITGLKYLGKTKSKDPHKYRGSGERWKLHNKKHGWNYTTEILRECQIKEEVAEWGLYYSGLWDVVASNEWANMRPENGDGGDTMIGKSPEEKQTKIDKQKATKAAKSIEEKQAAIDKRRATEAAKSPEEKQAIIDKRRATIRQNKLNKLVTSGE